METAAANAAVLTENDISQEHYCPLGLHELHPLDLMDTNIRFEVLSQMKKVISQREFIKYWQEVSSGDFRCLQGIFDYHHDETKLRSSILKEGDIVMFTWFSGFPGFVSTFNKYRCKLARILKIHMKPPGNSAFGIEFLDDTYGINSTYPLVSAAACVPMRCVYLSRITSKERRKWLRKVFRKLLLR